jgi:hypothetical protein
MPTCYDPARQKSVAATPEERVRQALARWLVTERGVPPGLIATEVSLSKIRRSASGPAPRGRLDLVAGLPLEAPWLLAECKKEGAQDFAALEVQVGRYLRVVRPRHICLALGGEWRFLRLEEGGYTPEGDLPAYPG